MKEVMVSVVMITYKHEKFIRDAINGVLMQECDFEVELIISDDCSPDNTEREIKNFENHPKFHWIKYTKHKVNKGMMPNFIWAYKQCSGKYIAICDGDDYWTDPSKLQKQVNFLNINLDFIIHSGNEVFHSDEINSETNSVHSYINDLSFSVEDFMTRNNLGSNTVLFRNIELKLPDAFYEIIFGDWFLYVILLNSTGLKAFRSKDVYASYRVHQGGIMSTLNRIETSNAYIFQLVAINRYLGNLKFTPAQEMKLNSLFLEKFKNQIRSWRILEAIKTFILHIKTIRSLSPVLFYIKLILKLNKKANYII